jgi:hypothetical protein
MEPLDEKPRTSSDSHSDQVLGKPDQAAVAQETKDNIVDWDGPDDPQNPQNWPSWKRMTQVILASVFLLTALDTSPLLRGKLTLANV